MGAPNFLPSRKSSLGVSQSALRTLCGGFGGDLLATLERDGPALRDADFHSLGAEVLTELREILKTLDDLI